MVGFKEREGEASPVAEAPVERAFTNSGFGGDFVHRDVLHPALGEELPGGAEDPLAVAYGVGPFGPAPGWQGKQLDGDAAVGHGEVM